MATERQSHSEAGAKADSEAGELNAAKPLNEAQRWWDAQMAEGRRIYGGPLKPWRPRTMTLDEAKRWLAEREEECRQERWKHWSPEATTVSE